MDKPLWVQGKYLTPTLVGVEEVDGYLYRGLAMRKSLKGSPKGRRPPSWSLTHIGSGHRLVSITAHLIEAFNIATELAELGDWTFDSLDGWVNQFPNAKDCTIAMRDKYPKQLSKGFNNALRSEEKARQIAMAHACPNTTEER